MKKVLSLLLLTVLFSTSSFGQIQKGKYEILGKLSGFPNSTLIYLYKNYVHQTVLIDSTFIINNAFQFDGSLDEPVILVL